MKASVLLFFVSFSAFSQHIITNIHQETEFRFSGQDGRDGKHGRDGRHAECNEDGTVFKRAEDGENGEDGKNGGNGKDVVVYYQKTEELKKLLLVSRGGKGGKGGFGGDGGRGCGGIVLGSGDDGRRGSDGLQGKPGKMYLVKAPHSYKAPLNKIDLKIKDIANKEFSLRDNIWEESVGANGLLASGSVIANNYFKLVKNVEKRITFNWQAGKDIQKYETQDIKVQLNQEKLTLAFPGSQVDYKITESNGLTIVTILDIYSTQEIFNLSSNVSGHGKDLKITLRSNSELLNLHQIDASLNIIATGFFSSTTTYSVFSKNGIKSYFAINGNELNIKLGEMPYKKWYKRKGQKITIYLDLFYLHEGERVEHKIKLEHKI